MARTILSITSFFFFFFLLLPIKTGFEFMSAHTHIRDLHMRTLWACPRLASLKGETLPSGAVYGQLPKESHMRQKSGDCAPTFLLNCYCYASFFLWVFEFHLVLSLFGLIIFPFSFCKSCVPVSHSTVYTFTDFSYSPCLSAPNLFH